jgi:hypothetical protein
MNRITTHDVCNVIENNSHFKNADFVVGEIKEAVHRYETEQENDPTATRDLVVENILYNIINNRKND